MNGLLASVATFVVFMLFCGITAADVGAGAKTEACCEICGFATSFVPPKLNPSDPNPVAEVPPNKLETAGLGCLLSVVCCNPNPVGLACIVGGLAGVEVAPEPDISNVMFA